ncbi:MAG TPA: NAD-dependent epimerase/dehydratase family protein, partial [Kofleriaceae bacterium]|nr:NAD-dependent epimerase/dehydratase family protein [Kofleriaceae bacterium]
MQPSDVPWLLVGCGYTGTRLARRLIAGGARVVATRRTAEAASHTAVDIGPDAEVRVADLQHPDTLEGLVPDGALIVHTAPPAAPPGAGEENLVVAAVAAGARRLVYVSSSGVYGRGTGHWIDEGAQVAPTGPIGARRLEAESALLAAAGRHGLQAVSLRAAAIYGPYRGVHSSIAAGTHRVPNTAGFVSRIHVDDLGSAILAAALADHLAHAVYNVADDEPTAARTYADAVAAALGVPPPPTVVPDQSSAASRELLGGDRRVSNRRLIEELGVELAYPSWREGLRQAMAEEAVA